MALNWRVLITLIGWLMLVRGAARILITDTLMSYANTVMRKKQFYPISGGVLVILGLVLSGILAIWPDGNSD